MGRGQQLGGMVLDSAPAPEEEAPSTPAGPELFSAVTVLEDQVLVRLTAKETDCPGYVEIWSGKGLVVARTNFVLIKGESPVISVPLSEEDTEKLGNRKNGELAGVICVSLQEGKKTWALVSGVTSAGEALLPPT